MKCDELKDYDIMDIEAMDDDRLEKSESGKIQATRVYIKSEADKVIAEKDAEIVKQKEERRWRKFSEEKPKDKQLVLVHGDNWLDIAIYHDNGLIDFGDDIHFSNITETPYWMPPPSAPKEVK